MNNYNLSEMLSRIKNIKKEYKITNKMLSQKTGISIGTLSKILAGITKEPSIQSIIKIANALNVSADYLITGEDYENEYINNLTKKEKEVIKAYRAHPEMQMAIDKMLDIKEPVNNKPTAVFHTNSTDDDSAPLALQTTTAKN